MARSTSLPALLACLLASLVLAAGAAANATDDRIVRDCQSSQSGLLTGTYTQAQLRHALRNMPADVLEYSGCYDAIRQAMRAGAAGGGDGGGGSGSDGGGGSGAAGGGGGGLGAIGGTGASGGPADAGAAPAAPPAEPHRGTAAPVAVGSSPVRPGELPSLGRDANALPGALVALLAVLGLAALTPAALTIGRRVVARHRA